MSEKYNTNDLLIILILFFSIVYLVIRYPITNISCNKQSNTCEITQNFYNKHSHQLMNNNDEVLIYPNYHRMRRLTHRMRRLTVYGIQVKDRSKYIYGKSYYYDDSIFAYRQLSQNFNKYLKDNMQNDFHILHIPSFWICLFVLFIIFYLSKKPAILVILPLYPFIHMFIHQIISFLIKNFGAW